MHRSLLSATTTVLIALASGASVGALGCFFHAIDDCDRLGTCELSIGPGSGSGGAGGTSPTCVPDQNTEPVADDCGIFVSSSIGSDAGNGTKAEPLKTLSSALERAIEKGKPLYTCAEAFDEAVEVPAGVEIYGGLDCNVGWRHSGEGIKTTIEADADEVPLKLLGGEKTTRIEDVTARAADAEAVGGSSIAVLADGVTAELVRCELVAGNGANGAAGAHGDPNGMPAGKGAVGNNGKDACSDLDGTPGPDAKLLGADQVTNDCGQGDVSVGGSGGDGNLLNGGGGDVGQVGNAGQAGMGEPAMGMWSCTVGSGIGNPGSQGEAGAPGPGAKGSGAISASGYAGMGGGAGASGKAGQGGGGGGGAKGGMICSGGVAGSGASGGSGGAGGCGGLPGQGGSAGGASIALVSVNASITLTDCSLSSTKGGDGGAGGDAQGGGPGGLPGIGGQGAGVSNPACSGGQGGKGGNGGPGGGGLGGPSLGIAFTGTPPSIEGQTSVTAGTPGAGGPGGSANVAMNAGATGIAGEQQEFP